MQALTICCKRSFFPASINSITQKGVMRPGHMYADLMGPSRLESAFNIGIVAESLQNAYMCDRILSIRTDSHLLSVSGIASNRLGDRQLILFNISQDYGPVSSYN